MEDAIRNESELNRKPFEKELKELDVILDHSVMSRRGDSIEPEGYTEPGIETEKTEPVADIMDDVESTTIAAGPQQEHQALDDTLFPQEAGLEKVNIEESTPMQDSKPNINISYNRHPTPILSEEDQQLPLAQGGIQWYMQPFDPIGTTIHEERWTGRDVMRGMSEELSELDEDELEDLVDEAQDRDPPHSTIGASDSQQKVRRTRRLRG